MTRNPQVLVVIAAMVAVDSSQIGAIGFDDATSTLQIEFKNNPNQIYQYDAPRSIFDDMIAAQRKKDEGDTKASVGHVFYAQVKDKLSFTRFSRATGAVEKMSAPAPAQDATSETTETQQAA